MKYLPIYKNYLLYYFYTCFCKVVEFILSSNLHEKCLLLRAFSSALLQYGSCMVALVPSKHILLCPPPILMVT